MILDFKYVHLKSFGERAMSGKAEDQFEFAKELWKYRCYFEAFDWYIKASDQGYADAQLRLGDIYLRGIEQEEGDYYNYGSRRKEGIKKDYKKAFNLFKKSAKQGNAEAQNKLGNCYMYGEGVAENKKEAVKWYIKSAKQNYRNAQYNLAVCYEDGEGVEKNEKKSFEWYLKAAEQGDSDAQFKVGKYYFSGKGTEQDYKNAEKWFLSVWKSGRDQKMEKDITIMKFLADRGHEDFQYRLGKYYSGYDEMMAFHAFRKAAEQGHRDAMFELAMCYEYGKGVEKNDKEANKWYKESAENYNIDAQNKCDRKGIKYRRYTIDLNFLAK